MGTLRKIRCRLIRVAKDVREIEADLDRYELEKESAKAKALERLKSLEAVVSRRNTVTLSTVLAEREART